MSNENVDRTGDENQSETLTGTSAQTLESIAANVAHSRRAALEAVDLLAEDVCLEQSPAEEVLYQLCMVLHGLQAIGSELRAHGVDIPRGEP